MFNFVRIGKAERHAVGGSTGDRSNDNGMGVAMNIGSESGVQIHQLPTRVIPYPPTFAAHCRRRPGADSQHGFAEAARQQAMPSRTDVDARQRIVRRNLQTLGHEQSPEFDRPKLLER